MTVGLPLVFSLDGFAAQRVVTGQLLHVPTNVGALLPANPDAITIVVKDDRSAADFLGGLYPGVGAFEQYYFLAYRTKTRDEVAQELQWASEQAAGALGFKVGEGLTLEISLRDSWIDVHTGRLGLLSYNCIGYSLMRGVLRSMSGEEVQSRDFELAYYEHMIIGEEIVGAVFGRPLAEDADQRTIEVAMSRILARMAWEVTARVLVDHLRSTPDPQIVARLLATAETAKPSSERIAAILWLGLVPDGSPETNARLGVILRQGRDQRERQEAAVALALRQAPGARDEIRQILSDGGEGSPWKLADLEQSWHLVKALALLGETDSSAKLPTQVKYMATRLGRLARFYESGQVPPLGAKEAAKYEKAARNLR